jgi:two-component system, response regulator YesN
LFTILLIEDEELIRKELVLTIPWDSVDCRIIGEARDGITGERLIRELAPDIVLTDIRLPGQSGLEMLEKTAPQTAIIFTGHSDFEFAQKALRLGVYDYLLKPIDEEELLASIRKVCTELLKKEPQSTQISDSKKSGDPYIRAAMDFIDNHFPEDLSLGVTAAEVGISESHLSHLFKKHSSYTFLEYLQECRIRNAMQMLKNHKLQIAEVYRLCGYCNGSYFSRVFKRVTGTTPGDFRNGRLKS